MSQAAPAKETPAKTKPNPNRIQLEYLHALLGKTIRIRLLDGKVLTGELHAYDTFTLRLAVNGEAWLIYKQAVAYLAPAGRGEPR